MSFAVFHCRNCGAGVESPPDNLLVVCTHCGDCYPSKELENLPISIIPSPSAAEVRRSVQKRMALDSDMRGRHIDIYQLEGVYVPIFITRTSMEGVWKGYKEEKKGKSTVKKRFSETLLYDCDFPVLARKNAHEFGLTAIGQVLFMDEAKRFSEVEWENNQLPILAVDIDDEYVDLQIKDDMVNIIGESIKKQYKLKAFTVFDASVALHDRGIVFFPFWTVMYKYKGGSYRVAVGGSKAKVIAVMEPVFLSNRLWTWSLGFGAILASGFVVFVGVGLIMNTEDSQIEFLIGIVALVGFCARMAWKTAPNLIASIRVETIGKDVELK